MESLDLFSHTPKPETVSYDADNHEPVAPPVFSDAPRRGPRPVM